MAELSPGTTSPPRQRGPLFYIGATGLLTATLVEAVAVSGRWLSLPLHGALEIIQTAILLTSCAAMLTATLAGTHATVHMLLNRLGPQLRASLVRVGSMLSAVFFVGLTIASVWLTIEHWNGHEESELLHIPFRPLRILCSVSMAAIVVVFLYRAIKPRRSDR